MSKHMHILGMHRRMLGTHNINVNTIHRESFSRNDWIAQHVGAVVGTMWFCYGLTGLMLAWALSQRFLGASAFDPYPFSFLFFMLGGIMQSLLMPLLMVKQNLDGRHSELLAEQTYHAGMESASALKELKSVQADHESMLVTMRAEEMHHTKMLEMLQADILLVRRKIEKATGE